MSLCRHCKSQPLSTIDSTLQYSSLLVKNYCLSLIHPLRRNGCRKYVAPFAGFPTTQTILTVGLHLKFSNPVKDCKSCRLASLISKFKFKPKVIWGKSEDPHSSNDYIALSIMLTIALRLVSLLETIIQSNHKVCLSICIHNHKAYYVHRGIQIDHIRHTYLKCNTTDNQHPGRASIDVSLKVHDIKRLEACISVSIDYREPPIPI